MLTVVTYGCAIGIVLAVMPPVFANPISDCNWRANDPRAVVHACTALLGAENAPEPWMYYNRGLAFKMLGQLEKAYLDYSKAIELNPAFGAAYTNRGNVRLLRNDVAGAILDFQTALELDPNDHVARENLEAIQAALRKVGADKSGKGATTAPAR
jgi:tetratricopeptide (TPR) repeat protein